MIIGGDCFADVNILEQLKVNLRIDYNFEDLIDILDTIGATQGRIVPILIDALNESWKHELWKSVLPVLYACINKKNYVRLAISFRSEYEKVILPDNFCQWNKVLEIQHQGFISNTIDAAQKFLAFHGLSFTPLHMFTSNIDNPLFLTMYCKTYQGDEATLPVLYERLLAKANASVHIRLKNIIANVGYDTTENLVRPVVEEIAKLILSTGKRYFERHEIERLPIWNELGLNARPFITELIRENILHDFQLNEKKYIYFAFDQMNDYYPAKAAISLNETEEELKAYLIQKILGLQDGEITNWNNQNLFISICVLYAEKYNKECVDIIDFISDANDRKDIFGLYLQSLEWRRRIAYTLDEFLNVCNKYDAESNCVWDSFVNNSVKSQHLLNADSLHRVLKKYTLAERDYIWTTYINNRTGDNDRLVQLIDMYNKGINLNIRDDEQIRLLLLLLTWLLTASNRWIRDISSKALIEILKDRFGYCEYLLREFSDVNDPYVVQRLYGVIYGACSKKAKENKKEFKSLVNFVYKTVFDKDIVYPDVLLRDYARLIIECFVYEFPNEHLNIDLIKSRPPYKSISIPQIEDQKYNDEKYSGGLAYIQSSMRLERMGFYGDFGRYVFQSAISNFDVDNYEIYNYAMYYIINELGYQSDLFDVYDTSVARYSYDRYRNAKIERIGKKYQWIALYNILARITDYYPMRNRFSMDKEIVQYNGPWEPYVRDFDPTLNEHNLLDKNATHFTAVSEHHQHSVDDNRRQNLDPEFDNEKWCASQSIFFEYQKTDLILKDDAGNQWIVLSKYADTGRVNMTVDGLIIWNWLYGYFVTDYQLAILKKYANKKVNWNCYDVTTIPLTYTLYNREYPWLSDSESIIKCQYINIELNTGKTKTITRNTEEIDASELGSVLVKYLRCHGKDAEDEGEMDEARDEPCSPKTYTWQEPIKESVGDVLNATHNLLWEEEYDASKEETISYSHPCVELITNLGLKQTVHDGYYYDKAGRLAAFDTALTEQKAGLVVRKDLLDSFISERHLNLVWFVNAAKEIHGKTFTLKAYTNWTGLLVYKGDSVEGEYYMVDK